MGKSKIINLEEIRKMKKNLIPNHMSYNSTDVIRDRFVMASYIIDMLFIEAEDYLKYAGFNPEDFSLIEEYGKACLAADLNEFFAGGEEALCLAYEAYIDGTRYCVVVSAMVSGNEVSADSVIVKWDGKEWLARNGDFWERGPGADYIS